MSKHYENNQILFIPDTHAPYHHKDAIAFLEAVNRVYEPDRVIHLGDWSDSYCFSRYPKDMEAKDTYTAEYKKVRKFTKDLLKIFPKGICMKGNHDARLWERAKVAGIPRGLLIPYEEVIGLKGTGWNMKWDHTLTVQADKSKWYVAHTKTSSPVATAKALGCNVVFGHNHTMFSINSHCLQDNRKIYGVSGGCLIGDDRYAFAYNRQSIIRPNLGCTVVSRGIPRLVPMNLTPSGKWDRKIS